MKINTQFLQGKLALIIIVCIAAFLRIYELGSLPPHLTPDEASLGYNAYSILKTGRDEYGTLLPLIFKSFGDYKPGLYVYTAVPSIALLGLNEIAVRLPSAIFGIIGVIAVYFISIELFKHKRLAAITSLLLAISPWHIHFSRGAWEINLSLMLTLLGILWFLKSLKNQRYLLLSALSFGLTLSAYQGAKLSTGIVVLLLVGFYWKNLKSMSISTYVKTALVGLLVSLPIILSLFNGQTGRLTVFSVFSYPRDTEFVNDFISEANVVPNSIPYYLFYSEPQNFARGILGRWFNHFSGRFLFFEGDWQNPRHTAPNHGVLLLSDLVFIGTGIVVLIKQRKNKAFLFFGLWLILSPLPAVLSRDQVHAVRSYNMVIPFMFIVGFGLNWLIGVKKWIFLPFIFVTYLVGFIYFVDAYFVHLATHNSQLWEYGYKQVVETVTPIQDNFDHIYVQQSYAQPYIFFLFYGKYDPKKYQAESYLSESSSGDVGQVSKLGNISFVPVDWSLIRGEKGTIVIGDTFRIPVVDSKEGPEFHIVKEIPYLNNKELAFRIIEIKR